MNIFPIPNADMASYEFGCAAMSKVDLNNTIIITGLPHLPSNDRSMFLLERFLSDGLFKCMNPVEHVNLPVDTNTNTLKGIAFVTFTCDTTEAVLFALESFLWPISGRGSDLLGVSNNEFVRWKCRMFRGYGIDQNDSSQNILLNEIEKAILSQTTTVKRKAQRKGRNCDNRKAATILLSPAESHTLLSSIGSVVDGSESNREAVAGTINNDDHGSSTNDNHGSSISDNLFDQETDILKKPQSLLVDDLSMLLLAKLDLLLSEQDKQKCSYFGCGASTLWTSAEVYCHD